MYSIHFIHFTRAQTKTHCTRGFVFELTKLNYSKMDLNKLNISLQNLKEKLKQLMAASAELIERNSLIANGLQYDSNKQPPNFEVLFEDFLNTCEMIELNLRTIQECLRLGKASLIYLPVTVSNMKSDDIDIGPDSSMSYNQYLSTIHYQVETAQALKSTLEDFVNQQNRHRT